MVGERWSGSTSKAVEAKIKGNEVFHGFLRKYTLDEHGCDLIVSHFVRRGKDSPDVISGLRIDYDGSNLAQGELNRINEGLRIMESKGGIYDVYTEHITSPNESFFGGILFHIEIFPSGFTPTYLNIKRFEDDLKLLPKDLQPLLEHVYRGNGIRNLDDAVLDSN